MISLSISHISPRTSEGSPDRPQVAEEESRRAAAKVPEYPEENHRDQTVDGRTDEGGFLLAGRGQVRQHWRPQPGRPAERQQGSDQSEDQERQRGRRQPAGVRVLPGRSRLL